MPLASFSLAPILRTTAASPSGGRYSTTDLNTQGWDVPPWLPTLDFVTEPISSPSHVVDPWNLPFENVDDIGRYDSSINFGASSTERLQLLQKSARLQEYVNTELSDQLQLSHLSDSFEGAQHHGLGRGSEFGVCNDEDMDACPATPPGVLDRELFARLTMGITIHYPSSNLAQPFAPPPRLTSIPFLEEASGADLEGVGLAATPKAVHHEPNVSPRTPREQRKPSVPVGRPISDDDRGSHETMPRQDVGGLITDASPAPSRTNSDVYVTPMSYAFDSPASGSETSSDAYATPMGNTLSDSSKSPQPDADDRGIPTQLTTTNIIDTPGQHPHSENHAAPNDAAADYSSPTSESEYATPMEEMDIIGSAVVSEKAFDDDICTVDVSVYERSVKLTATARNPGESIEAMERQLRFAAKAGNLEAVEDLLRRETKIDALSKVGMSALHLATYNGHSEVLKFLLDKGAVLYTVDSEMEFRLTGRNLVISNPHPIHLAALRGHWECVNVILEKSDPSEVFDLDDITDMGDYLDMLQIAIENDQVQLAKYVILSRGEDWFTRYEQEDETPLATAARTGSVQMISLFVDHGMPPNIELGGNITLLWIASATGRQALVDYLLRHDADVDRSDWNDVSPLDVAIAQGHRNIAKSLLDKGALIDGVVNDGAEPKMGSGLHFAVERGDSDMVQLLLINGANPNVRGGGYETAYVEEYTEYVADFVYDLSTGTRWTPLHFAADNGKEDMISILLRHGASMDFAQERCLTSPVRLAAERGHVSVLRLFRDNVPDRAWTPLGLATFDGRADTVEKLLEEGSDPNCFGNETQTPLHIAVDLGLAEIAELLLNGGADPNCLDSFGRSPFHVAIAVDCSDMVEILLKGGADVDICTGDGLPPLHIALTTNRRSRTILATLLDHGADPALVLPPRTESNAKKITVEDLIDTPSSAGGESSTFQDWHLMHLASGIGDGSTLESLLDSADEGQHPVRICSPTQRKETALHVAARAGHLRVVRLLANVDRSATNMLDSDLNTPLEVAVKLSRLDIAQELFFLGEDLYRLKCRNEELESRGHVSDTVSSSPLAMNMLRLSLSSSALYLTD